MSWAYVCVNTHTHTHTSNCNKGMIRSAIRPTQQCFVSQINSDDVTTRRFSRETNQKSPSLVAQHNTCFPSTPLLCSVYQQKVESLGDTCLSERPSYGGGPHTAINRTTLAEQRVSATVAI